MYSDGHPQPDRKCSTGYGGRPSPGRWSSDTPLHTVPVLVCVCICTWRIYISITRQPAPSFPPPQIYHSFHTSSWRCVLYDLSLYAVSSVSASSLFTVSLVFNYIEPCSRTARSLTPARVIVPLVSSDRPSKRTLPIPSPFVEAISFAALEEKKKRRRKKGGN